MILSVAEMTSLLRDAIQADNPTVKDDDYDSMTDDELQAYLSEATSRVYPSVTSLNELPNGSEYIVILFAKKNIYTKLAVARADLYDITAEGGNSLSRDQRFQHYIKLAEMAQSEIEDWESNGGGSVSIDPATGAYGVFTYDALLSKNHYTLRNYEKQFTPVVNVSVDSISIDSALIHWISAGHDHFGRYKVYIKEGSSCIDMYKDGAKPSDKLTEGAILIKSTNDIRDTYHRISGLKPNTSYYVAVFAIERNQIFGVKEVSFTTQSEETDTGNVQVDSL